MNGHINVRVHNKKTLELKLEYITDESAVSSNYVIDLYLLMPDNMGINEGSYEKRYFYHDLFRSIRLKSPDYLMNNYYLRLKGFGDKCTGDINDPQCIYQFKKFITGYRSMLRNSTEAINKNSLQVDIEFLLKNVHKNRSIFRKLRRKYGDLHEMFSLADEFTSIVTNVYLVRLYDRLNKQGKNEIFNTIKSELKYRKDHFPQSIPGNAEQNEKLINRYDYLKAYFYKVLSLRAKRKIGDKTIKNILYASAAGLSMIVATVIAFWAQNKYGNFTLPFFVALVVGYMFKDRIKDGFKALLERLATPVLFDFITLVYESTGQYHMGKTWERAGFVHKTDLPDYIETREDDSRHFLHFNKKVHINNKKIQDKLDPEIHGITDIMRLNINRFTSGLEEPLALMYSVRDDSLEKTFAEKIYNVELYLRVATSKRTETLHGILTLSAQGIKNFRIV